MFELKEKRTMDPKINNNFKGTSLNERIMAVPLPSYVKIPTIKYDSTPDSDDHLMTFDSQMDLYNASGVVQCRLFLTTLCETAAKWYRHYREKIIYSYEQFSYDFLVHFCASKEPIIDASILTNIKHKPRELLRDYLKQFNAEANKAERE